MDERLVAIYRAGRAVYPSSPPFHPHRSYPECPFAETSNDPNYAYEGVRECFRMLGFDAENYGSPRWNPMGDIIRPGDKVLIKPNLIKEPYADGYGECEFIVTHGSIIRAVLDYIFIALRGEGEVIIADAPQTDASFHDVCRSIGLDEIAGYLRAKGLNIAMVDLRKEHWSTMNGVVLKRIKAPGDPRGYIRFNLGNKSEFFGFRGEGRYYGADFDINKVNSHHQGHIQEYLIAASAIEADVFINLPKLKTHRKTGITACLKNKVGVSGDKNWLPHFTMGTPSKGGDQYPDNDIFTRAELKILRMLYWLSLNITWIGPRLHRMAKRAAGATELPGKVRAGDWYGNDTVWRMVLDLNKIIMFGNMNGVIEEGKRKKYLAVIDAILCGEGDGPVNCSPKPVGAVVCGTNPASVDATCIKLMGFSLQKVPLVRQAFQAKGFHLTEFRSRDVVCISNDPDWEGPLENLRKNLHFIPPTGWLGQVEEVRDASALLPSGPREHQREGAKVRVLINALSAVQGGGQTYLINLLKEAQKLPFIEIIIITTADVARIYSGLSATRLHILRFSSRNRLLRTVWENFFLPTAAKKMKADVVFCPGGIIYRKGRGYKTAVACQNLLPFFADERKNKYLSFKERMRLSLLRWLFVWSFRRADIVIFLNEFAKSIVESYTGSLGARARVIPHGLSNDFRTRGQDIERTDKLPDGDYILYVSAMDSYKSHLEVVEAFRMLCEERDTPEYMLFVGPDTSRYAEEVRERIRKHNLEKKVILAGSRPYEEMPSLYHNAKAIIFASRCENFPNIVLESLGAGKLILLSSFDPMPEIVGDAALYFDPRNPKELKDLLLKSLDDETLISEMGRKAYMRSFDFDWERAAESLFHALADICQPQDWGDGF